MEFRSIIPHLRSILASRRPVGISGKKPRSNILSPVDLAQQHRLARKLQSKQIADHYFFVDVVGTCNLRCPSCAVGNSLPVMAKGLMSTDYYQSVLDKLQRDYADYKRIFIDLYNWGEPALHPELPKIIGATKRAGMGVGISSNLNAVPNLRDIVKSDPDYIRISLSGFYNETYQKTHKGGNVLAVKSNMYSLAELCQRYRANTVVQVGFHIYRGNFPRDFFAIREMCDELGFLFSPVVATLMPAEKTLRVARGDTAGVDPALIENLILPIDESIELFKSLGPPTQDCQFRQSRSTINWDGSVALCCATYDIPAISTDFLNLSRDDLRRQKYDHSFCKTCMSSHVNKFFVGHEHQRRQEAAIAVLGPTYEAFLAETLHLGDGDYVVVENRVVPKLEVYQAAMKAMSGGRLAEAEPLFHALTDGAPDFGEGFFQAGELAMLRGNRTKAVAHYAEAVRLAPDHGGYQATYLAARDAAV